MRFITLCLVLAAAAFLAGCSHLNGTFISLARHSDSGDKYYEILPGEAAHEWMPKLIMELQPFDDPDSEQAKALEKKYLAYMAAIRGAREGSGNEGASGNDLVRKYFAISLVFATYRDHMVESRECYLFTEEGVVRVKLEQAKKDTDKPGFFRPAPGLRGLIEALFTPEAQERYGKYAGQ